MTSELRALKADLNALEDDLDRQKVALAQIEEAISASKNPNLETLSAVRRRYRRDRIKTTEAAIKEVKKALAAL